ncbi:hypothetical protein [Pendulispora albinea]|uniref:Uncharacterized protein n=1 Tax=Pendulispora albinea TaxID=2741071 RepID=A0ABZ2LNP0_9BACT
MPTLPREIGWLLIIVYVFGLVMLMTVGFRDGSFAGTPFFLILGCGALLAIQFARLVAKRSFQHDSARPTLTLTAIALTVFVVATFADARLLLDAEKTPRFIRITHAGQVVLLASYLPSVLRGVPERRLWGEVRFGLFALFLVLSGISVMILSPRPHGGAFSMNTEAVQALLHGENPYRALALPLGSDPPTVLYTSTLAFLVFHDIRWAPLVTLVATGFAMRFIARRGVRPRPSAKHAGDVTTAKASPAANAAASLQAPGARSSVSEMRPASSLPFPGLAEDAPALMLWLTPKAYFFVEQAYTDILPVAFLAFALVAHLHEKRLLTAAFLGLALSAKQSMIWLVPLVILLGFDLGEWAIFLGTAGLTIAPFAIWDLHTTVRFLSDLYGTPSQTSIDGITPTTWFYQRYGLAPRSAPGLLSAAIVSALAAWRAPRTRYAFSLSAMVAFFAFCVLGRSTFVGSYFFLTALASLTAAIAVGERFELG